MHRRKQRNFGWATSRWIIPSAPRAVDVRTATLSSRPLSRSEKCCPTCRPKSRFARLRRSRNRSTKRLQIDPKNDTAWHILGRWNRVLAEVNIVKRLMAGFFTAKLPKGSHQGGGTRHEKGDPINPNRLMHYIELGRIYAQMGRKDEARQFINKGSGDAGQRKRRSGNEATRARNARETPLAVSSGDGGRALGRLR